MGEIPVCVPRKMEHIWAKSPGEGEQFGQTLVEHTWEVLCRLSDLIYLRPNLPMLCGVPRLWHLLFWAAFLHDWGKAAQGFQLTLRGKAPRWNYRHEVLSLAFVDWIADGLTDQEKILLVATIATHHKDFPALDSYLYPADADSDPLPEMVQQLARQDILSLYEWLLESPAWLEALKLEDTGVYLPTFPSFEQAIASISPEVIRTSLCHLETQLHEWEDEEYLAENPLQLASEIRPGILTRGTVILADHLASAQIGDLPSTTFDPTQILQLCSLSWDTIYSHQQEIGQVTGHALLSAPTGSGKTEAALLWAVNQRPARIFYTLPYQASMNAMYDRLQNLFPDKVGLLHGRSTLSLYRRLMEKEYSPHQAAQLARLLRNKAGLAYYPVRIFSPYQMLKAPFQLKGFEALLSDFAESAFIFDEIHAYEPRRLAMIIETISYLARYYGVRVLIMSATLPHLIRTLIEQALSEVHHIQATPEIYARFRRHRLQLLEGDLLDSSNLNKICEVVKKGKQTLVVCNTVKRAQKVWEFAREILPYNIPCFLLHSRFSGRDRIQKEGAILQKAGINRQRRQPLLVVATQVVEVSLNLDLDMLFSDPAPLEALLQRFGRINRTGRLPSAPVFVFREVDPIFGKVYHPIEQITQTLAVLESELTSSCDGILIDEAQLPHWLDEVYTGSVLQSWMANFQKSAEEFRHLFLQNLLPWQSNPSLESQFDRLFDGTEVLPESFYEEYTTLHLNGHFLECDELLVPISWGHFNQLVQKGLLLPGDEHLPPIVCLPYDIESGLAQIPQTSVTNGDENF